MALVTACSAAAAAAVAADATSRSTTSPSSAAPPAAPAAPAPAPAPSPAPPPSPSVTATRWGPSAVPDRDASAPGDPPATAPTSDPPATAPTCVASAVSSAASPNCSGSAALTNSTPGKEKRKAAAGSFRSERRQWKARVRAPVGRWRRGEHLHAEERSVASGRRGCARLERPPRARDDGSSDARCPDGASGTRASSSAPVGKWRRGEHLHAEGWPRWRGAAREPRAAHMEHRRSIEQWRRRGYR